MDLTLDFQKLEAIMRELSLQAGDAIMEIYNRSDFEVKSKSDNSPVTAADEAADALISVGLLKAFPDVTLITEEQFDSHSLIDSTFLIVDPLDGTKEFIQRRGDFTVNIAYVENGIPIRGIVYAPAKRRLFYTDSLGVVASKSHRDQATDNYISKYETVDVKSAGSSLKFCLIATGEADFYPRMGRTMEWDTAAGHAILIGAGGDVVRFDDLSPLTYGKADYENPFFIAYARGVLLLEH